MPEFPSKNDVFRIHADQIEQYGGLTGVRDRGLLESALAMPQAMFSGRYLHADLYEMAAAYLFHLVSNHPFLDGNKRTGAVAALFFLSLNGLRLQADNTALESLVLSAAGGQTDKAAVAAFFRKHCTDAASK